MYSTRHGVVFGFHGCDRSLALDVVLHSKAMKPSENDYDWLGHGMYFWEGGPRRALQFTEEACRRPARPGKEPIRTPFVLGAAICLGRCLDLLESESLTKIKKAYDILHSYSRRTGSSLPRNTTGPDLLQRFLDCAVIEVLHEAIDQAEGTGQYYDSVRGVFTEGKHLYENAGFHEKDHIQLCIRNPNCIKGYFIPRELDRGYRPI